MSQTLIGGKKAVKTTKQKHGEDFYIKIGGMGGKVSRGGGFADRELAKRAGALGGRKSKRGKAI